MARAAPGAAVALTVFLDKVFTGLGQTQDVLYFTTFTGNGENLMPHMNAIKEQANFFPKNRLVVDAGTMEHVKNTGSLENTKVVMDLDADVFAKAKARVTKGKDPRVAQELDRFYDTLQEMYNEFRAVKIAMITSTKRTDRSLEKQLSFVEPSYFYERRPEEYPDYTQFNSDLILMRKAAATNTALVIGRRAPLWPEYTPARLKTAYVGAIGLNPLGVVLRKKEMEATWAAAGPHSPYVEINGEKFIRRDTCPVLRTLVLKGDMNTRKLFLSNCALNPADVGAVSRQDAQNWFGDSKSDRLDVPVYTLEEEASIALPDGSPLSLPEHSGPSRPEQTEVETPVKANPPVETGLSDIPAPEVHPPAAPEVNVDVSTLSLGFDREPHAVNPETGHEAFNEGTAACGSHSKRRRRASSRCSLYDEENFSVAHDDDILTALVKAFVQKRRNTVELARTQLEEIMSDPEVELAVKAMMTEAQGLIPGNRGRAVKRLGPRSASPRSVDQHRCPDIRGRHSEDLCRLGSQSDREWLLGSQTGSNVRNVAEGHHSPADYYWLTRSSMQVLSLVFESLNAAMLPMVSVDILVTLITQGEYATHVVRSVGNKLPLSTKDMWTLGTTSFFGSSSWLDYYNNVADLERVNSGLANSLAEALRTVNVVVGFPVSTVMSEWRGQNGKQCVDRHVEVWPAISKNSEHDLSQTDFSMEHSVPLKEVYIGDVETQQLCYQLAHRNCLAPNRSGFHKFMELLAQNVGALPTNEECAFYDQTVPNATDPCGAMDKFIADAVERRRFVQVTTPERGDPLMEPQLRAVTVKAYDAKMISRPLGWLKESPKCSKLFRSKNNYRPLRAAKIHNGPDCICLKQCVTRRYIGTAEGEVVEPFVFRKGAQRAKKCKATAIGGSHVDTVITGTHEKLWITILRDGKKSKIKGRDLTLLPISIESIRAAESPAHAVLEQRMDLRLGGNSQVVLEKGSQFSTLKLGSNSTVLVKDPMTLSVLLAKDTTGVVVSAAEHLDVDEITLVVRPETSLVPQPEYLKRAYSAAEDGVSLHKAVLFKKGRSAVSIDPEGIMLTCSVTGDAVYRSAYKDLSTKEGEVDPGVWREKLDEMVRAGLDEMTVTTPQGVKVVATASQQTAIGERRVALSP
ncbi:hypothetical protein Q5P01_016588 [Channa striata]|uniref:Uncharacterized protein n=1 Tax=Channa striata TaxID=64152 RepID=A0AA88SAL9_CHASR|nr:hypothetical protein Q5P01_016588 [Channa striata]